MEIIQTLEEKCTEIGIEPTHIQIEKVMQWVGLLQKWNKAYNLTALTDTPIIIHCLVLGSLEAIPHLRGNTILDVGSGGGVPGIPLAIFAPQYQYTLIDGNNKKARFLEHCRIFLKLENLEVKQVRSEDLSNVVKFDTIISRALGKPDQFITTTAHLGHKKTRWLTFKGKISEQELQKLQELETELKLQHSIEGSLILVEH